MPDLFSPLTQRSITFRNRIGVSPMCQYSADDGVPNDWHLVHLGARAVGGAGLVISEATAVEAIGRISPGDTGIWNDQQASAWSRINAFIAAHGAVPGIQLAHAGRKASTAAPWTGGGLLAPEQGGWQPVGASALPFSDRYATPLELSVAQIEALVDAFVRAARRAMDAGFKLIEIHAAHGYLMHSFYSPLSNHRTDQYGGSFDNRVRLTVDVARAVRNAIGDAVPLWTRLSTTDWTEGGWSVDDSVVLARRLKDVGVDTIDCSSGGNVPRAKIPIGPGYQVPAAARIRAEANVSTAAVGLITEPQQAQQIIASGQADFVLLARQSLRDPHWPAHAARALGQAKQVPPPKQYERAWD